MRFDISPSYHTHVEGWGLAVPPYGVTRGIVSWAYGTSNQSAWECLMPRLSHTPSYSFLSFRMVVRGEILAKSVLVIYISPNSFSSTSLAIGAKIVGIRGFCGMIFIHMDSRLRRIHQYHYHMD